MMLSLRGAFGWVPVHRHAHVRKLRIIVMGMRKIASAVPKKKLPL
jgi:hypothetical protein